MDLEQRVTALEKEVADLKRQLEDRLEWENNFMDALRSCHAPSNDDLHD